MSVKLGDHNYVTNFLTANDKKYYILGCITVFLGATICIALECYNSISKSRDSANNLLQYFNSFYL